MIIGNWKNKKEHKKALNRYKVSFVKINTWNALLVKLKEEKTKWTEAPKISK